MAPIVVSSLNFAAAPRLLLRMATPQPIAQHEHARVRFVERHEVTFCVRGCMVDACCESFGFGLTFWEVFDKNQM